MVCLFLSLNFCNGQDWAFDEKTAKAYQMVLNLQIEEVLEAMPKKPKTAEETYVAGLAEALELLITENPEKFQEYEDHFENRIETKWPSLRPADHLFLQAELRLQWAFVYLKFGHEFDAALNIKHAYEIAEQCKKKFPKYQAIKKTSGLLQIIIGSVPEKYNWVLGLLGIEGSVQTGLSELETLRTSSSVLNFETNLLYALVQGFILQQTDSAVQELKKVQQQSTNKIALFLGAALAIKNSQSEEALVMLNKLNMIENGLRIYYAYYLRGEIYLQKADYLNSLSSYRWFIDHYEGKNYIKDAYYKIGLCYWLNGNENDALTLFKEAKAKGLEETEADKHAAKSLAENELPHTKLTKARYYTDGGYYEQAASVLSAITPEELPTQRDKVEFHYRKARLAHKRSDIAAAKLSYQQTIDLALDASWYFAPNSCLQMGYIFVAENDADKAKEFFEKALEYKKHEYKNSIDSKAKSALAQLKRK